MKALVAHPGGFGEVLLAGPAVRAVATRAGRATMLCGARGAPAAGLLPHVDDVVIWDTPDDGTAPPAAGLIRRLRKEAYDVALVLGRPAPPPACCARPASGTSARSRTRSAVPARPAAPDGPAPLGGPAAAAAATALTVRTAVRTRPWTPPSPWGSGCAPGTTDGSGSGPPPTRPR
jgi:hypothetical protein